jgi:3-deoxy-D-manno-octulosonic-acid transferase
MRLLYSLVLNLMTPLIVLRLWIKGRRLNAYKKRIRQRFGYFEPPATAIDIWLHAVSLGEVIAATPLIEQLLDQGATIAVTTMTPTGSERVVKQFGKRVFHVYLPIDTPHCVKRFLRVLRPKLGIIMETELWPNLIHYCHVKKIPLFLINARLSDKSFQGYRKIKWFIQPILDKLSLIVAQSTQDASRFEKLGMPRQKINVLGNIKFDLSLGSINQQLHQQIKKSIANEAKVLIAASTHNGEEKILLKVFARLKESHPNLVLMIAPRHPERFLDVFQLCNGFECAKRSDVESIKPTTEVIVIDSLGELLTFYSLADIAFVGGSLVPIGGHNMLEPMALDVPVISGNYLFNFKAISQQLLNQQAMCSINSENELYAILDEMLNSEQKGIKLASNARRVLDENKGAVTKLAKLVMSKINNCKDND